MCALGQSKSVSIICDRLIDHIVLLFYQNIKIVKAPGTMPS